MISQDHQIFILLASITNKPMLIKLKKIPNSDSFKIRKTLLNLKKDII